MHFNNIIYTRKWTKMFAPISTFINQLGKQFGFQTIIDKNSNEELLTKVDPMSNEHVIKLLHDNKTNPSINFLSTIFSTVTSPFRSNTSLKYTKKHDENHFIYHEINNDENNNNKIKIENNQNSVIINLPTQQSNDIDDNNNNKYIFTYKHFLWLFVLTILYFTWFIFLTGVSLLHVLIYLIIITFYLLSDRTRRFILALFIYLTYLFLYDSLHLVPNYTVSKVHIRDIYLLEKKYFGILKQGHLMTLNEYFKLNHIAFLDIYSGISYLSWIPIPIAYSLYLYRYKSKRDYIDFAFTFLLTNMVGFVIYYIVPAAPPWYIELYGFNMNMKAPGSPAGFSNFDRITGIKIFSSMYSKNANVFAAIPSLHAAYPLITVLYGSLSKKVWLHIGFVLFTVSVWFSAIYSRHHYVIDVLAGSICALTAYTIYRLISRIPTINRLLVAYSKLI